MLWLLITILAYLFLAICALGDKFLLKSEIPNPKVYSFYVGLLSIFVVFLSPLGFSFPSLVQIFLSLFTGAIFILALYLYYSLIKEFEVSRISPAIGAMVPIFTLFFLFILSKDRIFFSLKEIVIFLFFIIGSLLIVFEKEKNIFGRSFISSLGAAFYFSLYFSFAKFIYDTLGFLNGFIWIRLGSFLTAILFLFFKEVRSEFFHKPKRIGLERGQILFFANQTMGGLGAIFQNLAIALAPVAYVPFVNALQGIQYIFLLIFITVFSFKAPEILREEISKLIFFQKLIAILLISVGLALFALK